jgi:hypothetical protein
MDEIGFICCASTDVEYYFKHISRESFGDHRAVGTILFK